MHKKDVSNKIPIYKLTEPKDVLDYYDNWTKKDQYNKDMIDWNYTAPQDSVVTFKKYAFKKNLKILDAGCGSGLVGIELKKEGYINIEGADFSQSMLDLIPKDVYKSIDLVDLNRPLKYKASTYDAVICVGTFTYGHAKAHVLDEFVRITKKNSLICFTINEGIYKKYGFDKKIRKLAENGSWDIKELFISDYIASKDVNAWLCIAETQ